ncbi:hypothetical protein [Cryobacterium sp. SO1]|uniref:hypothetical protein n=1 Tax=Cryobacterium sp. SO1 TaxID=1897061 RepID=UPI0010239B89|nr:hypothetical protein [Cryobacterium sp. SO1]RZI34703.1 hypothetical protein BJQ95_02757 [Cryobacterium sp. SO1]
MSAARDDVLAPWRNTNQRATRIAVVAVTSTLAVMLVTATLPLWVGDDPIRTVLLAVYNGNQVDWAWTLSPPDVWWAVGLILLAPVLCTMIGAVVSRRRLSAATVRMPRAAAFSTIGSARSAGQRSAQVRNRQVDLAARQRRVTELGRFALPIWSILGAAFGALLGGWFLIGIALDVTGATATPVGAWVAVHSWWLIIAVYAVSGAILSTGDSRRKRRGQNTDAAVADADQALDR